MADQSNQSKANYISNAAIVCFIIAISFLSFTTGTLTGILRERTSYATGTVGTKSASGSLIDLFLGKRDAAPQADPAAVPTNPNPSAPSVDTAEFVLKDDDHVRGNAKANIVLFEYSDLECPFCKSFHPTTLELLAAYGDKVALVYRHFPLDSIHPKARKEAEAVECVAELGGNDAFWKMVDNIFEVTPANNGLDPALLPQMAVQAGVSESAFNDCLSSNKMADKVQQQVESGQKVGVSGTPNTFIVNMTTGKYEALPGAYPLEQTKQAIDRVAAE